jgi:energy-coupling factor transport system substrate-specific component
VSEYAVKLARKLGWSEHEIKELEQEALLHDIGKIGVPDAVLNKPGKLSDAEFETIKSHTTIGKNILDGLEGMHQVAEAAAFHHERYDGKGYPEGLKGANIPVHARIISIADAFDAMRSDRVYRKGLPSELIREELMKGCGAQFDPLFLPAFVELLDEGKL